MWAHSLSAASLGGNAGLWLAELQEAFFAFVQLWDLTADVKLLELWTLLILKSIINIQYFAHRLFRKWCDYPGCYGYNNTLVFHLRPVTKAATCKTWNFTWSNSSMIKKTWLNNNNNNNHCIDPVYWSPNHLKRVSLSSPLAHFKRVVEGFCALFKISLSLFLPYLTVLKQLRRRRHGDCGSCRGLMSMMFRRRVLKPNLRNVTLCILWSTSFLCFSPFVLNLFSFLLHCINMWSCLFIDLFIDLIAWSTKR